MRPPNNIQVGFIILAALLILTEQSGWGWCVAVAAGLYVWDDIAIGSSKP